MKELLRTQNPTLIPYVQALLEGEGIEAFVLDVHMSAMGIVPQRMMVRERDHFMARAILRDNDIPEES